ncbi:MAG: 50S ribosomal protein L11 methyltransferase [Sphingobacteriaceae bacterium]|nr:50S ribosomal protein L11 methyltransferase [Sphingobacteriaceae bacterium]
MSNYIAYYFKVEPPQPGTDILIASLGEAGFESFVENEEGFEAYINEELEKNINLNEFTFEDFKFTFEKDKIEQSNWNAEWEKNFEPVLVEDLLLIRAPFHAEVKNVKHEVVIMPKMSFGTGHHDTTWLMCKQLFDLDLKNKSVLDMGTGTGILAIVAKKLGASPILGIDIDEWSAENAKENCIANGGADIEIKLGDKELLDNYKDFAVILANINKNVLKIQIPLYSKLLKADGVLLMSGFFTTDVDELEKFANQNQLKLVERYNKNDWAVMKLRKS